MPNPKKNHKKIRKGTKQNISIIWKENALVYLEAGQTKYFNTTDFTKVNTHPWRLISIKLEVVSPQKGTVIEMDILSQEDLSIATTKPRTVGSTPKRFYVRNPNHEFTGAGKTEASNILQVRNLCINKNKDKYRLTGHITITIVIKPEILQNSCPTLLKTKSEIDLLSLAGIPSNTTHVEADDL